MAYMPYLSSTDTVLEHRWKMLFGIAAGMIVILIVLLVPFLPALTFSSAGAEKSEVLKQATDLYEAQRQAGYTFTNGPCLAESLRTDWAADIVHNPRQPVDDLPANQCQSYRTGTTHHIVELSPDGTVVRVQ